MPDDSRALPAYMYHQEPSTIIENAELAAVGCEACSKSSVVLGKRYCTDPKNDRQKGVPRIGSRCKLFDLVVVK